MMTANTVSQVTDPKHVLVTGSAGAIGNAVSIWLQGRGHTVRGVDLRPTPNLEDAVQGDLAERDVVYQAMEGMDTVVHLAAYINTGDLVDVLLAPNVISPYYVCQAAADLGVTRLVLASSVQVVDGFGRTGNTISVEDGMRPNNLYALAKAWGEIMGEMYARLHGMSVINVRIGWLPRSLEQARSIARRTDAQDIYLSYADAQRFFERCVEANVPQPGQSITLFAGSKAKYTPHMDLEPAKQLLGYEPQDVWPENMPYAVE